MLEVHAGGSPTLALIQTWGQSDDATLGRLMKILNEDMQRHDIVSELEEVTRYKCPEIQEQDAEQHVDTNQTYQKDTAIVTAVKEAEMIKTELPGTELKFGKQYGSMSTAQPRPSVTQFSASSLPSQDRHLPNGKMFEKKSVVVDKEDNERNEHSQLKGVTSLMDQALTGSMRDLGISKEVFAKSNIGTSVNSSLQGQKSNKVDEVTMLCSRNDDMLSSGLGSKSAMMRYKAGENGDLRLVKFVTGNGHNPEWNDTESFGGELNPFAPTMAKTQLSFGHLECKRVNPIAEDGTILQQDHVSHSNGRTPIQTEPSMSSASFINLKKERETEKLRVRMIPQRNPGYLTGQEGLETDCPLQSPSVSSQINNYVNLHADDEPRSLDFDETTGSFQKVTTCCGISCMDETMCNICINRCSRLPGFQHRPNDTVENFISTDLSSSIFHSSLHINNETCIKPSDNNDCEMQGHTLQSLNLKKRMDDTLIDSSVDNDKHSDRDDLKSVKQNEFVNNNPDKLIKAEGNETEFESWSSFMSLGLGAAAGGVLAIAMYKSFN